MSLAAIATDAETETEPNVAPTRAEVEDLLFQEAHALDDWRLEDWFDLFAPGATYEVPTANSAENGDSAASLFYIADDYDRIRYRVNRLLDVNAHAEFPRSTSSRLISNVRILGEQAGGWRVRSVFITHRSKGDVTDVYAGHHIHVLRRLGGSLRIAAKTTHIDMGSLRPQGRVSIIL
jgi:p-cumate 2,3-dioxygenase beta subunit